MRSSRVWRSLALWPWVATPSALDDDDWNGRATGPVSLGPGADEGGVGPAGLAVGEGGAVHVAEPAACGFEDGLGCGGIPFHSGAEAGVEVGGAFRDADDLEGRAHVGDAGDGAALEELLETGVAGEGAGGEDMDAVRRDCAGSDAVLAGGAAFPGARGGAVWSLGRGADDAAEHLAVSRDADDAEDGAAVADEADVDGELVTEGGELAGAVEGVDEPVFAAGLVDVSGLGLLLGDDRDVRGGGAEAFEDEELGGVVGFGDGAFVALLQGFEAAGADAQDQGSGAVGEVGGEGEEGDVIHSDRLEGRRPLAKWERVAT